MRLANGEVIMHAGQPYDPQKAHDYYERTKKLKGRKKGQGDTLKPANGQPKAPAHPASNARQKKELAVRIQNLEGKLQKLEALIKKKEHAEQSDARKAKAKKNASAKEAAKPDTAAEKAKKAREGKKYRAKNKTKLGNKAKTSSSGGSKASSATTKPSSGTSVKELKTLAVKVKGQLAVAKTKLRAL